MNDTFESLNQETQPVEVDTPATNTEETPAVDSGVEADTETKPELDPVKEAVRLLQEEQQKNLAACSEEINVVLQKHGFTLRVESTIVLVPTSPIG